MTDQNLRILLVEDDPDDVGFMNEYLQEIYKSSFTLTVSDLIKGALKEIEENVFDIIILDLTLPDSSGMESLVKVLRQNPNCPVIILTGINAESIGIEAVKIGAQDYLEKNNLKATILKHSITHSLERYKLLKSIEEHATALEEKTSDLIRKQQQFEEAQKMAHIGSWEWDINANSICWSDELFRIFGLKPQEILIDQNSTIKFVHPDDKELINAINLSTYKNKIPYTVNYRIIQPDGLTRLVNEKSQVIKDSEGNIIKMYGMLHDITEQRRLEEVTKANEIAEQLTVAKDQFIASMSHEIRTPLNGIIGFTNLLLKNETDDRKREQLQAIKSSGNILLVIINDILEISKIEAGKIHIEETEIQLTELINTIITSFELRLEEKNLQISYKKDSRIPKILSGDPVRIEQILLNLLNNAIKFTGNNGKIDIQTLLLTETDEEAIVEFIISDTGIGIPSEKIDLIFEPFVQAGNDIKKKYEGTGLGLSIVKRITELMGGTISVKSVVNEGSTFTFTLPLKKSSSTEIINDNKKPNQNNLYKEIGGLTVLLAEDSDINTFLVKSMFSPFGFKLDSAENGKTTIDLLEKNDYDIILMDLMMPEMDGFEATKYIRNNMNYPKCKVPIIAFTADVNKQVVIKCTQAGMNDYISKPFNEIDLLNKIGSLVKIYRQEKFSVKNPEA